MFRDTTEFLGGLLGTPGGPIPRHFVLSWLVSPVLRVIVSVSPVTPSRQIHIAHGVWGWATVSILLLTGLDDLLQFVIPSGMSSHTRKDNPINGCNLRGNGCRCPQCVADFTTYTEGFFKQQLISTTVHLLLT